MRLATTLVLVSAGAALLSGCGSAWPAGEAEESGLGLGFFIAKTLLERSGAGLAFLNRQPPARGAVVRLTPEQLADLAADQTTFMGFFTHGTLDQTAGRLEDLLDWWLVLRSALDGRSIHTAPVPAPASC